MGTRGLFGFYHKGKYYVVYNHFDSYPDGLGRDIVEQIKYALENNLLDQWKKQLDELKIVSFDMIPTSEDIEKLKNYTNLEVGGQATHDWYCLLRCCQGSLMDVLNSGYLLNRVNDDGKPLFQECAYILNFDNESFDFYCGDKLIKSYALSMNDLPDWGNNDLHYLSNDSGDCDERCDCKESDSSKNDSDNETSDSEEVFYDDGNNNDSTHSGNESDSSHNEPSA